MIGSQHNNASAAYQRFLNFFTLTQRERLDGLDDSYFSAMTDEERKMAFAWLRTDAEKSLENIRGLYLCDKDLAVDLFKSLLLVPMAVASSKREQDELLHCRIVMAGYVCLSEPTEANINSLASIDVSNASKDVRNAFYNAIPSSPTTVRAVDALGRAILNEVDTLTAASAITKLLACYDLRFDMHDQNYKRWYRALRNVDTQIKIATLNELNTLYTPNYANN